MKQTVQLNQSGGGRENTSDATKVKERFTSWHLLMVFFAIAIIFGAIMKSISG